MSLFEITLSGLQQIPRGSFAVEGVKERQDLQQWLRINPVVLGENLLIIAVEFGSWEDSKRRIDLLALDEDGNLVVIELKRTEDGGHMDLQAIRYAAMISAMRFDDVVRTFEEYLKVYEPVAVDQAQVRIRQFLGTPDDEDVLISTVPRILLVSADFSLEITTTVLWLIDRGIDIRCIQIAPYKIGEKLLIDLRQVIPLAQARDYQIRLRQKEEVVRQASGGRRELTLKVLARHGIIEAGTEIEIVPIALPVDHSTVEPNVFRARIADPTQRSSVTWLGDDNTYSLTQLTRKLTEEHGVRWLAHNIAKHWRIVGQTESLWNQAERLSRDPVSPA